MRCCRLCYTYPVSSFRRSPSPPRGRLSSAWRWLTALLALAGSAALYTRVIAPLLVANPSAEVMPVKLERVADGDTLHLLAQGKAEAGEGSALKVRLIGIDCPELGNAEGFRAATAISLLCEGALKLELEPQRKADGSIQRDKFGRILGWLWVTPGPDWPRQRDWLLRYPASIRRQGLGGAGSGVPDFLRQSSPGGIAEQLRRQQHSARPGQRTLVQEELLLLELAELYRDAKGSKHFARLEAALQRSRQQSGAAALPPPPKAD